MGVSKNNGTPKSSILIGFSIINHPFWGKHPPILGNIHMKRHILNLKSTNRSKSWGRCACWPLSYPMTPVVLPNVASASPHPGISQVSLPQLQRLSTTPVSFLAQDLGCCGCHLHLHINEAHGLRYHQILGTTRTKTRGQQRRRQEKEDQES